VSKYGRLAVLILFSVLSVEQLMSAAVEDAARNAEMWGCGTNGLGPAPTPSPAPASIPRPARYDLKGIRDRMKQRYVGHTFRAVISARP
jgi:hypothetical protein